MDSIARKPVIATLLALGAIFGILYAGNTVDFLSGVTKPAVILILKSFGVHASDSGTHLNAGSLEVPWTGDCAGLNILAILVAVTLWANRRGPFGAGFWARLLMAFPIAYVANIARILSLIGLRRLLYPAVEDPSLHYFIGFLWVLPFLAVLIRRPSAVPAGLFWLEILRIASVLSLLAPFVPAPGGVIVTASSLVLLARHKWASPRNLPAAGVFCGWLAAGLFIAGSRMGSLWIPWLLVCPGYMDWRLPRLAPMLLLLPGTVPLFAMKPWAAWVVIPAVCWEIFFVLFRDTPDDRPLEKSPLLFFVAGFFHIFPFVTSVATIAPLAGFPPPPGVMRVKEPHGYYSVRTLRQPPGLLCLWFEPSEGGRHHTLEVCLQYRGIRDGVRRAGDVVTDGSFWYAEFFLLPNGDLCNYHDYLAKTFLPFSANGAHLIFMASKDTMDAAGFLRLSRENAGILAGLLREASGPHTHPANP
jgi:exosortase/archaeosortase family protein